MTSVGRIAVVTQGAAGAAGLLHPAQPQLQALTVLNQHANAPESGPAICVAKCCWKSRPFVTLHTAGRPSFWSSLSSTATSEAAMACSMALCLLVLVSMANER